MKVYWKDTPTEIPLAEIREKGIDWVYKAANPEFDELVCNDDHVRFKLIYFERELNDRTILFLADDDEIDLEQVTTSDLLPPPPTVLPPRPGVPSFTTVEIRAPPMDYADWRTQDWDIPKFSIERAEDAPSTSNPNNAPFVVVRRGDELRKAAAAEHKYSKQAALLANFGYYDMVLNKELLETYDGDLRLTIRDLIKACS